MNQNMSSNNTGNQHIPENGNQHQTIPHIPLIPLIQQQNANNNNENNHQNANNNKESVRKPSTTSPPSLLLFEQSKVIIETQNPEQQTKNNSTKTRSKSMSPLVIATNTNTTNNNSSSKNRTSYSNPNIQTTLTATNTTITTSTNKQKTRSLTPNSTEQLSRNRNQKNNKRKLTLFTSSSSIPPMRKRLRLVESVEAVVTDHTHTGTNEMRIQYTPHMTGIGTNSTSSTTSTFDGMQLPLFGDINQSHSSTSASDTTVSSMNIAMKPPSLMIKSNPNPPNVNTISAELRNGVLADLAALTSTSQTNATLTKRPHNNATLSTNVIGLPQGLMIGNNGQTAGNGGSNNNMNSADYIESLAFLRRRMDTNNTQQKRSSNLGFDHQSLNNNQKLIHPSLRRQLQQQSNNQNNSGLMSFNPLPPTTTNNNGNNGNNNGNGGAFNLNHNVHINTTNISFDMLSTILNNDKLKANGGGNNNTNNNTNPPTTNGVAVGLGSTNNNNIGSGVLQNLLSEFQREQLSLQARIERNESERQQIQHQLQRSKTCFSSKMQLLSTLKTLTDSNGNNMPNVSANGNNGNANNANTNNNNNRSYIGGTNNVQTVVNGRNPKITIKTANNNNNNVNVNNLAFTRSEPHRAYFAASSHQSSSALNQKLQTQQTPNQTQTPNVNVQTARIPVFTSAIGPNTVNMNLLPFVKQTQMQQERIPNNAHATQSNNQNNMHRFTQIQAIPVNIGVSGVSGANARSHHQTHIGVGRHAIGGANAHATGHHTIMTHGNGNGNANQNNQNNNGNLNMNGNDNMSQQRSNNYRDIIRRKLQMDQCQKELIGKRRRISQVLPQLIGFELNRSNKLNGLGLLSSSSAVGGGCDRTLKYPIMSNHSNWNTLSSNKNRSLKNGVVGGNGNDVKRVGYPMIVQAINRIWCSGNNKPPDFNKLSGTQHAKLCEMMVEMAFSAPVLTNYNNQNNIKTNQKTSGNAGGNGHVLKEKMPILESSDYDEEVTSSSECGSKFSNSEEDDTTPKPKFHGEDDIDIDDDVDLLVAATNNNNNNNSININDNDDDDDGEQSVNVDAAIAAITKS